MYSFAAMDSDNYASFSEFLLVLFLCRSLDVFGCVEVPPKIIATGK
jgi:hypothetical protein